MPRKKSSELQEVSVVVVVNSGVISNVFVYKNLVYAQREYYRLLAKEFDIEAPENLEEQLEIDELWEAQREMCDNDYELIETKVRI